MTFDNWKTTTIMRRKTFYNRVTGHIAIVREVAKDGQQQKIIISLEDETGTYRYNGIPLAV